MSSWLVAAVCSLAAGQNPVFDELTGEGVSAGGQNLPLAAPLMADGLDAEAQRLVLEATAAQIRGQGVDALLAENVSAPVWVASDAKAVDGGALRTAEFAFVAHGPPGVLQDPSFHQQINGALNNAAGSNAAAGVEITDEALAERGIGAAEENEGYGHGGFRLLDKVEVAAAGRSYYTSTDQSLILASLVDPRFADDPEFPNHWRRVQKQPGNNWATGPWAPYGGAGVYTKITPLAEPDGALFIETHVVFFQPTGWFANPRELTRKIPLVGEEMAERMRREILRFAQQRQSAAN